MEYVFDFMRLLGGDRGGGRAGSARRRGAPGLAVQLRLVFYGVLLGLMMPVIRQIDWSALVPPGVRIDWPRGFGIAWPAGGLHVPGGWGSAKDAAVAAAPSVSGITAGAAAAGAAAAGAVARAAGGGGGGDGLDGGGLGGLGGAGGGLGSGKAVTARFTICGHGKRVTCMVDGDTFWLRGTKVRIADIDTPETHPPRCRSEARAGQAATVKMQAMLNAGPFTLVPIKRDVDRYGRKLRIVERDGVSLGAVLVRHGLARHYGGGKRSPWC